MPTFTLDAPGVVTTNEEIMYEFYGLEALGPNRILTTASFWEHRPDLGELQSYNQTASWSVSVPPGAQLFGATCSFSTERTGQYWVGWLHNRTLAMQALKQERPYETQLAQNETLIFPAVMSKDGRVAVYSWRLNGEETVLWRRTFTGRIHQPVTMVAQQLTRVPGRPLASRAGVIANLSTSHAILGWTEEHSSGAILGAALIEDDEIRVFRSEPIAGMSPFARQRLSVWAESFGCVEIAAVLQSRIEPAGYALARFSIGQNAPLKEGSWHPTRDMPPTPFNLDPPAQKQAMALTPLALKAGDLHVAALEPPKMRIEFSLYQLFLTRDGRLLVAYEPGSEIDRVRRGIPLDNPLAVVTGNTAAYWGTRHADGTITLESLLNSDPNEKTDE